MTAIRPYSTSSLSLLIRCENNAKDITIDADGDGIDDAILRPNQKLSSGSLPAKRSIRFDPSRQSIDRGAEVSEIVALDMWDRLPACRFRG